MMAIYRYIIQLGKTLCCGTLCWLLTACTNSAAFIPGPINEQGLATYPASTFDQLAIKPEVNFSQYKKIKIEPITVSFSERRRSLSSRLKPEDFEFDSKEEAQFNQQFFDAVSQHWASKFGWEVTESKGEDVLVVKAAVSELYLNAPIKHNLVYPSASYTNETSTMIINIDLIDSTSAELLLTSSDKKTTGDSNNSMGPLQRVDSVIYWRDAYRTFQRMASQLSEHISY